MKIVRWHDTTEDPEHVSPIDMWSVGVAPVSTRKTWTCRKCQEVSVLYSIYNINRILKAIALWPEWKFNCFEMLLVVMISSRGSRRRGSHQYLSPTEVAYQPKSWLTGLSKNLSAYCLHNWPMMPDEAILFRRNVGAARRRHKFT